MSVRGVIRCYRHYRGRFLLGGMMPFAMMPGGARAQSAVLQIPSIGVAAGIAAGQTQTPCSTSIPTLNGMNTGDGCPPTQALLSNVDVSAVDSYGNIYLGDSGHVALRVIYKGNPALAAAIVASYNNSAKVSSSSIKVGNVYTLVGGCTFGTSGCFSEVTAVGGIGTTAILNNVTGISLDADGNVFFAEGQRIRAFYVAGTAMVSMFQKAGVAVTAAKPGYQYTLIAGGSGSSTNNTGYSGDGGMAGSASVLLDTPRGLAVDSSENLYIADYFNRVVREVTASTGLVSTFAGGYGCVQGTDKSCSDTSTGDNGPATSASISTPTDVALDVNGNVYISEYDAPQKIRAVYMGSGSLPGISNPTAGYIYTVAGGGATATSGAAALSTKFGSVTGIGFDRASNLYVVEKGNHLWEIEHTSQLATILAGGGSATTAGSACVSSNSGGAKAADTLGDGCPGIQASLNIPYGHVTVDSAGNLYVSDSTNNLLRVLSRGVVFPATAVGSSSTVQTVAFASLGSFTIADPGFGVQGTAGSDFSNAGGSSCVAGFAFTAGKTCWVNTKFTPQLPGLRDGYVQLASSSGTAIGSFYLGGTATGPALVVDGGSTTKTGSGLVPRGVAVDPASSLYVADGASASLLQFSGASATTASATLITGLSSPGQVTVDGVGNVAVADAGNNRVAVYNKLTQSVSSLTPGLNAPQGVAAEPNGNYFVADTGNNRVLEVSSAGGIRVLSTSVVAPTRVALDASGNLYILDSGNHRVVKVPGGSGTQAIISTLSYTAVDMVLDPAGDLYVLDSAGLQVGVISASGASYSLFTGLHQPLSLVIDAVGDLYVADAGSTSLLSLNRQATVLDFGAVTPANTSAASSFLLTSTGNADVTFSNSSIASITGDTAAFASAANANACTSTTLTIGSRCGLSYTFTPPATGMYAATVTFPADTTALNSPAIALKGIGEVIATALTFTPSSLNATAGAAQTITVTATAGSTTATSYLGTVQFTSTDGGAGLPAAYTFTAADAGSHTFYGITFATDGVQTLTGADSVHSLTGTASVTVSGTAGASTSTLLSTSTMTPPVGSSVTLTATVSSASGTPAGSVSFASGSVLLGTASLSGGVASITTALLPSGANNVVATYTGSSSYASSNSVALIVTVSPQNVWIVNSATLSELSNSGAALSGSAGYAGGGTGIAIDGSGNVWSANSTANTLTRLDSSGSSAMTFSGGGMNGPLVVAVSGSGAIWVANANNTLSLFDSTGVAISPTTGYTGGGMNQPSALALDAAGNVWVANKGSSSVTEFLGAADPVITPASVNVKNSTQGVRP